MTMKLCKKGVKILTANVAQRASDSLMVRAGSDILPYPKDQDSKDRGLRGARTKILGADSKTNALKGTVHTSISSWVFKTGTSPGETSTKNQKWWCDTICHTITKKKYKINQTQKNSKNSKIPKKKIQRPRSKK